MDTSTKILPQAELANWVQTQQAQGRRVVFSNGCFDLMHPGHVTYLEAARSLGDCLVLGVNSDASIRRLKGADRPILPLEARLRVLAGLQCVDALTTFEQDTPLELIQLLSPQVLAKGADYQVSEIVGAEWVQQHGGAVARLPLVAGYSTSDLIQRIQSLPK
ncbi:MAG: D-glycero-beta-D-manno-heptose 1-phosphate adenylyltransferase [Bacteroidota bacterium]